MSTKPRNIHAGRATVAALQLENQQLRRALRLLLTSVNSGRPADPRDCAKWDRAVAIAEHVLQGAN